jgi:undecaprenyl-diphosphatase
VAGTSVILGLVQGLTEFLPVSSSGHLALAQWFFGFREAPLSYDILLHVATMAATVLYFWRDLLQLSIDWFGGFLSAEGRRSEGWRFGWAVFGGSVMTVLPALALKRTVEGLVRLPWAVALALLVTALILLAGDRLPRRNGQVVLVSGLFVGLVQGLAVIPGISRSGSTIIAGLAMGLKPEEAFRFSFLLSIPAVCGATVLQLHELGSWAHFSATLPPGWFLGTVAAFLAGFASLVLLRRLVTLGRWKGFGFYCLSLSLVTLGLYLFRG